MKIVINGTYGGFGVTDTLLAHLGAEDSWDIDRTNPDLIWAVEHLDAHEVNGNFADLRIAEIPDESTDWIIEEYDGLEKVMYVLDGKIHWTYGI